MAITERYFNPDLATGLDDGTSEVNAWQTWTSMQTGHVAGEHVNAKKTASPYQPGADIAFAVSATDLLVSIFRGYGSTIGDGVKFQFDMQTTFTLSVTGESCLFQNVDATGSDISNLISVIGDGARIENFKSVNTGISANSHNCINLNDANAFNGYAETNSTSTNGAAIVTTRGTVENCIAVSTSKGIKHAVASRAGSIVNCLIYRKGIAGGVGLEVSGLTSIAGGIHTNLTISGFTDLIDCTSMDDVASNTTPLIITDSILANGTTGIANTDNATKVMAAFMSTIAFYNISGSDTEMGDNEVLHEIQLSADPFVDAGNENYALNNTAGGGADCRAAVQFGGGVTPNFIDIGAQQHEDTGGGGDPFPSQGIQSLGTGLAT